MQQVGDTCPTALYIGMSSAGLTATAHISLSARMLRSSLLVLPRLHCCFVDHCHADLLTCTAAVFRLQAQVRHCQICGLGQQGGEGGGGGEGAVEPRLLTASWQALLVLQGGGASHFMPLLQNAAMHM